MVVVVVVVGRGCRVGRVGTRRTYKQQRERDKTGFEEGSKGIKEERQLHDDHDVGQNRQIHIQGWEGQS